MSYKAFITYKTPITLYSDSYNTLIATLIIVCGLRPASADPQANCFRGLGAGSEDLQEEFEPAWCMYLLGWLAGLARLARLAVWGGWDSPGGWTGSGVHYLNAAGIPPGLEDLVIFAVRSFSAPGSCLWCSWGVACDL